MANGEWRMANGILLTALYSLFSRQDEMMKKKTSTPLPFRPSAPLSRYAVNTARTVSST